MGYDASRFTSSDIDKDLMCQICLCVLEKPVETPCEHCFCEECLLQWLRTRHTCPLDNDRLSASQLTRPSRLLTNQLGRLQIECDFKSEGCQETVPLELLAAHRLKCPHNPRPGAVPPPAVDHVPLRRRQAPLHVYDDDDDDGPSNLEAGLAIGGVAVVGAAIGALVSGLLGYKRGRNRND